MAQRSIIDLITARGVKIVSGDLPLQAALSLLEATEVDALLVLSESGPCGVVRPVTFQSCPPTDVSAPIASCMTLIGPAIPAHMDAAQALRVMRGCGRNDLPVMDAHGTVVSLLSVTDLMMALDFDLCEDLVA